MDDEFPGAIDIMVRGIRTGMPLIESMRVVASEGHPIIAKEFQKLIDELALGVPFTVGVQRMAPRIPIADMQFFAVVLGLQAEAGGAVADTLQSAAETMRNRRELRNKVSIMSREARSSAAIIGSLPIIVSAVMAFTSPDYIGLLLTTSMGNIVAVGALLWAGAGILVMRAMINFEI
jgi:tight adherence protein B